MNMMMIAPISATKHQWFFGENELPGLPPGE